jgi:signal transduction histidine kinase
MELDQEKITLSFSAGWTAYEPGEPLERFLARADQALYTNKLTGSVEEQVRQVHAQRRQAQKMQAVGRLIAGVAHDFNNLLMVIKGYNELLMKDLGPNHRVYRMAEEMRKASERASSLVGQLMAFSRQQKLERKVVDLNRVVSQIGTMLRRVVGEDIELVTVSDPTLGSVEAAPHQLDEVILNLAANARDAMPQGGRLKIATSNVELDGSFVRRHHGARPGAYVRLEVSDAGSGMDKATQRRLFEPFFTTKGEGKGTGLGLATVYGIIKQHGGYIGVESEPSQGTTFSIYLPRVKKATEPPQANATAADSQCKV